MDWLYSISCVFLSSAVGFCVISPLLKGEFFNWHERLVLSFGAGAGLISLEMFLLSWIHVPLTARNILLPWCFILPGLWVGARRFVKPPQSETPFSVSEKLLFAGITFEASRAFFRTLIGPIESYDGISNFAFKGKVFFFEGILSYMAHPPKGINPLSLDYPLAIPLLETWMNTFVGHWNEVTVKLIFPIYFVCLLVVFYSVLRRVATQFSSLLFTFFLASTPQINNFATNGYADLPFAFYAVSGFLYLFLWMARDGKGSSLLLLSSILESLAIWTKHEGWIFFFVGVCTLSLFLIRKRQWPKAPRFFTVLSWTVPIAVLNIPWYLFKWRYHIPNLLEIRAHGMAEPWFYRIWEILYEFHKHPLGPKKWNILWIIFFYLIIKHLKKPVLGWPRYALGATVFVLLCYSSIFLVTPFDVNWDLRKSFSRLLIHVSPLALFWGATTFERRG